MDNKTKEKGKKKKKKAGHYAMIVLVIKLYLIVNNLYPQHGKYIKRQVHI